MEIQELFMVLGGLLVVLLLVRDIIMTFYVQKSIPLEKVAELIKELRPLVESTATKADDILLDTAEELVNAITPENLPETGGLDAIDERS